MKCVIIIINGRFTNEEAFMGKQESREEKGDWADELH